MTKTFAVVHGSQEFKGFSEKLETVIEYKNYNITLNFIFRNNPINNVYSICWKPICK